MKIIPLTKGLGAVVDDQDYKWLSQWKWCLNCGYAARGIRKNGKLTVIYMHRLINKTPKGLFTDHINRNTIDNRRENLRSVTHSENVLNQKKKKTNPLKFKGITQRGKNFVARFKGDYLGSFKTQELAFKAYSLAGGIQ